MVSDILRPKYHLIHRYTGWMRDFGSEESLVTYLREHQFTRRRLYEFIIIHGEGIWCDIANHLPVGDEAKVVTEQSPF